MIHSLSTSPMPSPSEVTQIIESDDLARYVVEQLHGRIVAIQTTDQQPDIHQLSFPLSLGEPQ